VADNVPSNSPNTALIEAANKPTIKLRPKPRIVRVSMSRPSQSVPNG